MNSDPSVMISTAAASTLRPWRSSTTSSVGDSAKPTARPNASAAPNPELLQERVHRPAGGADRQQRQQRERRGVGEGQDMHQPRHPDPVRVGEVMRAAWGE